MSAPSILEGAPVLLSAGALWLLGTLGETAVHCRRMPSEVYTASEELRCAGLLETEERWHGPTGRQTFSHLLRLTTRGREAFASLQLP